MKLNKIAAVLIAAFATAAILRADIVQAQPAKGAPAAFERVREKMSITAQEMKLAGDPDGDFAALLIAQLEDSIHLANTQLEFGGDAQMRQLAQKILDERQKELDELKRWQARNRQPTGQPQANASPVRSASPDEQKPGTTGSVASQQAAVQTAQAPAQPQPSQPAGPLVPGRVEKVDSAAGKITIEHGPIPNLDMEAMTMVFRAGDPAMLKQVKRGDRVRFTAERVNGQITVTKIQKGR
jgi:Cu/Ag efflux protein CusF